MRQFADPASGLCSWVSPPQQIPANETERKGETLVQRQQRLSLRNQRLLETYHQDRRNWAWEISRSFARCCHMLTAHANAYANEGFLGTATQWEHVRRLVEMLDYHPAPPASASVWLSFTAKEGKSGVIAKGFQVKNSPPAGSDKVIFETLEDVFIDAALNELRPKGWNKSEQQLAPAAGGGSGSTSQTKWSVATKPAVEPSEVAMIKDDANDHAEAVMIIRVDEIDAKPPLLELDLLTSSLQNSWGQWAKGNTLLHYSPRWHRKCWLNGANVIRTCEAHGLTADAYVGWKFDIYWRYAKILEVDKRNLRLDYDGTLPERGDKLYLLTPIVGDKAAANLEVVVLLGDEGGDDIMDAVEDVPLSLPETPSLDHIFTIPDLSTTPLPISLPPLLPPGALPGIGSFLFPTPFLPVDLVKAAVELMLNLGVMQIPSTGEIVIKGLPLEGMFDGIEDFGIAAQTLYDILSKLEAPADTGATKLVTWIPGVDHVGELETILKKMAQDDTPMFQQVKEEIEQSGPLLAISKEATSIAEVVNPDPLYMFDRRPDSIQTDDWVVAEFSNGLSAAKISSIDKFVDDDKTESFALSFENLPSQPGELRLVHADFRGELVPQNATINLSSIDPENFELEQVPENLKVGRQVLITGCGEPSLVKITDIDGDRIIFDTPLPECLAGNLVILGNVVLAGHGETQPQKIIGSGNAVKSNQAFVLDVEGVSFTPDATKSAGVAAAIEVEVAGRVWEQVSSLKDSIADDHHYEIRMTEEGYVRIIFGDGSNGRRLPSGKNNLRVRYRVGSGIAGNVPADSLIKAVKPNPLLDSVLQPLPASGGGDMENQTSLRENAPPTLLALKRAVSLNDFSHLAAAQSSIWRAKAYSELLHGGRMTQVTVIVVPAGGVFSPEIKNELQAYLQKQSLPGVKVSVAPYHSQTVDLKVTIRVDSAAFIPQDIAAAVEKELTGQFALQNRALGEPLYLSEVYKVVESIEGVENSICVLNDGARVVKAEDRDSVVHLDIKAGSSLMTTTEEYRP